MSRVIARGIGIDPGTTVHACALLEACDDGMIWVRELHYYEYERSLWANLFHWLRPRDGVPQGVVALETVTGGLFGDSKKRKQRFRGVTDTVGSERLFRVLCKEMGVPFVDRPAGHGRKKIIGSWTASDPQIRAGLEAIYTTKTKGDDLPFVARAKDREHCYDSVIVGMTELYERMAGIDDKGARTPAGPLVAPALAQKIQLLLKFPGAFLPDDARRAVDAIRRAEQNAIAEEKARKKLGLPGAAKERRRPSRAVAAEGKAKAAATKLNNKIARM